MNKKLAFRRGKPRMDSPPLDQMISFRVSRLQSKLNAQAIKILKEHADLTPTQWRVLVMLETLGECTSSEIARTTQLDKGLLSRTIKGMMQHRLIKGQPSKANKRHMLLRLTDAGRDAYERARPYMQERHELLLDNLSARERRTMFDLFDKLEESIGGAEARAEEAKGVDTAINQRPPKFI